MQNKKADIKISVTDSFIEIHCIGRWEVLTISDVSRKLENIIIDRDIIWNMSNLIHIDTSAIVLFKQLSDKALKSNYSSTISLTHPKFQNLYNLLYKDRAILHPEPPKPKSIFYKIGVTSHDILNKLLAFLSFFGEAFIFFTYQLLKLNTIRYGSIAKHIYESGIKALPIIAVSSFLIGVVIAYQSIVQLSKFGADIFIVDTIGISITRELAPLITAIVIAGRSGSAFTAQIGAMKITQEIDAMKTMGFDIFTFIVWPRVIALMIVMPLLIFFSDIIAIAGGVMIAISQSNITISEFFNRLYETLTLKHYIIGIIKGPFFAFLIAFVGVYRGFQVSMNTESIGKYTTKSVVNAIFLVIACDAIFSIILTELKL